MVNNRNQNVRTPARRSNLDQSPDTISTDALINNFNRFNLDLGHSNSNGQGGNRLDNENPFLDSTTSYIDANLDSLREFRRKLSHSNPKIVSDERNVSESTVEIDGNHLVTPLRRTISGSSLQEISSPEFIPNGSRKRSNSSPQEHNHINHEEPILDLSLFNLLLDQLPNIEKFNNFKGVLSKYLEILVEHEINIASDRFIITIYNQLKNHYHHHNSPHPKLEKIIQIFLKEPVNFAMKLSNHLYFKELSTRQKFFRIWLIKRRINYELNQSWKIWNIYLQKKYLSQWIYKYKAITEDLQSNAVIFNDIKQLMRVWDIWRTNTQQRETFVKVADLQQESKFFNSWKIRIDLDNDKADEFYQNKLMRNTLKKWRLSSISINYDLKLKSFFSKWKEKQHHVTSLQNDGEVLEKVFHGGFFFAKWKARSEKTLTKTKELEDIHSQAMKAKYFSRWTQSIYYKSIENQVLEKRDIILKEFVLNQWCTRLNHEQMLESFQNESYLKLKSKMIKLWKRQLLLKKKAEKVGDATILKTYFKVWKLKTNEQIQRQSKDFELADSILLEWKRRTELQELSKDYELQIQSKYWDKMILKKIKSDNALEAGTSAYESFSKIIYLNHWRKQLDQTRANETTADKFLLKTFFKKIQKRQDNMESLENKAIKYHENFTSKIKIKSLFSKWHSKYEDSLNDKLELKLSEFTTKSKNLKLSSIMKTWNNQYNLYLDQEKLYKEDFLSGLVLRPVVDKWISKYNTIREMEDKADDMNNLNLLSSGFTKIQLALFKLEELENNLIEFEDDSNVKLILKYLNTWSLKLLKVKRDNENISSFQRRWNRAHCRAILLLWKGKIMDRQQQQKYEQYEISGMEQENVNDVNDDEDDDDSPTKFKSTFNSVLPTETPRKSIIHGMHDNSFYKSPLSFGTNQSTRTTGIPGSERIKKKRIEALKSHYSQIKYAIPSPLKSVPRIKNEVKSEPRKLNFNKSHELKLNQSSPKDEEINGIGKNYFMDDSFSTDLENPISSPVISHQKINQHFFNRYSSNHRPESENEFI